MCTGKIGLLFLIALLFTATTATSWAGECSLQTVKGTVVVAEQGTTFLPTTPPTPIPLTLVATSTFDGAGNFKSTYTAVCGGTVLEGNVTGTYTVTRESTTSACLYEDTFTPPNGAECPTALLGEPSITLHHKGYISGEGEFQEAHYTYVNPGGAVSGTAKRAH